MKWRGISWVEGISFSRLRLLITTSTIQIRGTASFGINGEIWWMRLQRSFLSWVSKPIRFRAMIKTNLFQRLPYQKCNYVSVGAGMTCKRQSTTCRSFTTIFCQSQALARPKPNPSNLNNKKSLNFQLHCPISSKNSWSWPFTDTSTTSSRSKTGSKFKWESERKAVKCWFTRKKKKTNFQDRQRLMSLKRNLRKGFSQSNCSNIKISKPLNTNLLKKKVRKFGWTKWTLVSFWPNFIITTLLHFTHFWSAKNDGFSAITN